METNGESGRDEQNGDERRRTETNGDEWRVEVSRGIQVGTGTGPACGRFAGGFSVHLN